jgi:hypothetical protein
MKIMIMRRRDNCYVDVTSKGSTKWYQQMKKLLSSSSSSSSSLLNTTADMEYLIPENINITFIT